MSADVTIPAPEGHQDGPNCECAVCRLKLAVELPDGLIDACETGELVVFAGAGVSTESRLVLPYTLEEQIRAELQVEDLAFPDLMELFCDRHGRAALLRKIRSRFDYLRSFPELYGKATRFHYEIATIYPLVNFVTTNWDTAFEDCCGATPIVGADDYAFWDEPGRKVFKLHGSIANWGSVVATRADYDRAETNLRSGVVGASFKHLLATKRVLFAGYSFRDPDFQEIYRVLREEMGEILPRSFVVTLDPEITSETFPDATILRTDATHLIATIKDHLIEDGVMLPDENYDAAVVARQKVSIEHYRRASMLDLREHPDAAHALVYQDGLLHAFERALALRKTGEYSHVCEISNAIGGYELRQREKRREREYLDVAYLEGYLNGLRFLLADDDVREHLPLYFVHGSGEDIDTLERFLEVLPEAAQLHKTAARQAERAVAGYSGALVPHHPPLL